MKRFVRYWEHTWSKGIVCLARTVAVRLLPLPENDTGGDPGGGERVTEKIRNNFSIEEHRHVPIEEAKAAGAMALFGEKYGDHVRTVRFGSSIELCGGTHISATRRIGTFRIVSESAITGVRRIEAVTAKGCEDYLYSMEDLLRNVKAALPQCPEIMVGLRKLLSENEEMRQN